MASKTDYKISYINFNPRQTVVKLRFYEGEVTTELEDVGDGPELITRYRRTTIIKRPLIHFSTVNGGSGKLEEDGNAINITIPRALTLEAIRTTLDVVLARDLIRTSIDEQTVTI